MTKLYQRNNCLRRRRKDSTSFKSTASLSLIAAERGYPSSSRFAIDIQRQRNNKLKNITIIAMITRNVSKLVLKKLTNGVRGELSSHSYSRISEAGAKEALGKRTRVQGWVRAMRKMKESIFLDIDDGSTSKFLQVVVKKRDKPEILNYGCSVTIEGELAFAPNGRAELHADKIDVHGICNLDDGYPFAPRKQYSTDYVRQYLHLRCRTRYFSSLLRLRDLASAAVGQHMRSRNYIAVNAPILTSNDCEGAGEVFTVQPESKEILESMKKENVPFEEAYFNGKAYLSVSGQMHLEAMARALTKVYTFGPTFRAENSKSRLHLSEFYMIEAEAAFMTKIEDVVAEAELLVKSMTRYMLDKGAADMESIGAGEPSWLETNFGVISYDDAIQVLEKNSDRLTVPVKKGEGFPKEHELFLVQHNNGVPIFVINWPKESKPFYMKECEGDESKVAAMDLLAPEVGELFGGSLREDDYEKLKSKLPSTLNLDWYLELRRFGNVPTGGYGMGFERFLQCVLGTPNIKDVIPFPRWPHNCSL